MVLDSVLIFTIALLILCFFGLSWFAGSDAPFVPSKLNLIPEILKKAGVKKGKVFYELGSGDGRVVIEAAKLGAQAIGIEQSWIRVWYSRIHASRLKLKDTIFYHGDIFRREYYPADVVFIYMLPKAVARLEKKLKQELKKNAVVITQTYHFTNWKPYQRIGNFWFYRS